ncbi:MAG: hypothetical protein JWO85_2563 [Candidatus Eremiobacteraeota bacterium]|nr:hypothetical protein [Candidatus Eremiobacteraeota bacterium]
MDKASAPAVTPTVGRIVHFVLPDGQVRPAIIVRVWSPEMVNLRVFLDGTNDAPDGGYLQREWATSVHYREYAVGNYAPGTWFWPPREPVASADPRGGAA